jgi:hypothetical protein
MLPMFLYFLFLQGQLKGIIIIAYGLPRRRVAADS